MSAESLRIVTYNSFNIRFYVVGKVAYICPEDLRNVMLSVSKDIDIGEDKAWDKVDAGRRIFSFFDFFEWFSDQFDAFDYADDVILLDPLPW
ncbi:hypothetical protein [Maridesulfovibrio zosterae]|uniref:hypothetical protein n=1 Tax=Maridesulfovibrio zosterae TaxID=82171 RepID=UPI00040B239F|nr:hypothetical protein [Maridesulfovibrio zosterae]